MSTELYILIGGKPVPADLQTWARCFESEDRHVEETSIPTGLGFEIRVSTIFLGIDHNHFCEGPPVLWETMVFGGTEDGACWRYASETSAREGHARVVAQLSPYFHADSGHPGTVR